MFIQEELLEDKSEPLNESVEQEGEKDDNATVSKDKEDSDSVGEIEDDDKEGSGVEEVSEEEGEEFENEAEKGSGVEEVSDEEGAQSGMEEVSDEEVSVKKSLKKTQDLKLALFCCRCIKRIFWPVDINVALS